MAGSVNKVILIGNLGKDPEVRHLGNGAVVANITIATSESYQDKATGERRDITDWHDVVLWRGLAEITERFLKKGMKVYIEGKLKKRSWQDKEGQTRYSTEVVADDLHILSKIETANNQNNFSNNPNAVPNAYSSQGTPSAPGKIDELLNDDIDDLPF